MRNEWFVDQSVSSKARRAASIARCISAGEASATCPMTSSVAGLTLSKRWPESASTSLPSINILGSGLTFTASATAPSSRRSPRVTGRATEPRHGRRRRRMPGKPLFGRVSDFDVVVEIYGMPVQVPR